MSGADERVNARTFRWLPFWSQTYRCDFCGLINHLWPAWLSAGKKSRPLEDTRSNRGPNYSKWHSGHCVQSGWWFALKRDQLCGSDVNEENTNKQQVLKAENRWRFFRLRSNSPLMTCRTILTDPPLRFRIWCTLCCSCDNNKETSTGLEEGQEPISMIDL